MSKGTHLPTGSEVLGPIYPSSKDVSLPVRRAKFAGGMMPDLKNQLRFLKLKKIDNSWNFITQSPASHNIHAQNIPHASFSSHLQQLQGPLIVAKVNFHVKKI